MRDIRVAAVQFNHRPGDKETNLAIVRRFVEQAARQKVEIIAFPECCISGYWHLRHLTHDEIAALAEPVPDGPTTGKLSALSRECGLSIGAGFIERTADGALYNTYVLAMPNGEVARHRKLHPFVSPFLSSGTEFTVFQTPHGCRVGMLICYDANIIENARITALMGAEILLAPHQTGGCRSRSPFAMGAIDPTLWKNRDKDPEAVEREFRGDKGRGWLMRWLPSRAHDNGMFLVFSNGVGLDDDEVRTGNAMVIDCYGRIIAETCKAGDDMVIADLDASLLDMSTGRRWLKARRPELYGSLVQRTGAELDTRAVRFGDRTP